MRANYSFLDSSPMRERIIREFVFAESKRAFCGHRWFLSPDASSLCSSDFSTDAVLSISGDFETDADRVVYGYWLMRVINLGEAALMAEQGSQQNNEVNDVPHP